MSAYNFGVPSKQAHDAMSTPLTNALEKPLGATPVSRVCLQRALVVQLQFMDCEKEVHMLTFSNLRLTLLGARGMMYIFFLFHSGDF